MIWLQGLLSMIAWLGYGIHLRRGTHALAERMLATPRPRRVLMGTVGMIGSGALLLMGLWLIGALGGMSEGVLTLGGWVAVTALGLVFVHLQVVCLAAMVSLVLENETARIRRASEERAGTPREMNGEHE